MFNVQCWIFKAIAKLDSEYRKTQKNFDIRHRVWQ